MKKGHIVLLFLFLFDFCFMDIFYEHQKYRLAAEEKKTMEESLLYAVKTAAWELTGVTEESEEVKIPTNLTKMFEFRSLEQVERLAVVLGDYYRGENDFYKDETKNRYYLLLRKGEHTPEEFNKVCNIISEYASQKKYSAATEAFFMEHGKLILGGNALAVFATLN